MKSLHHKNKNQLFKHAKYIPFERFIKSLKSCCIFSFLSKIINKFFFHKTKFNLGDTWVDHRQFLEESFKLDILKGFISIFVDSSNQMVKSLGEENESKIDVFKSTSRCALTMVLATSFGIKSSEVHFDDEILKAVEE